jgi:hypothetical protein
MNYFFRFVSAICKDYNNFGIGTSQMEEAKGNSKMSLSTSPLRSDEGLVLTKGEEFDWIWILRGQVQINVEKIFFLNFKFF